MHAPPEYVLIFTVPFHFSQRTYVGINANSVKCIWEQYNNSGDIELNPELMPIIAEDTSYKLWEFIHNLKTYARHSGGRVTTDIVNEVLKDCNEAPIIGATSSTREWTQIVCDGTFYYQHEEELDLRHEFSKDLVVTQSADLKLEVNWMTHQRHNDDLAKLWQSIVLAIVLGDDAAFQYTIHTTLINPYIGCILPHLMQKIIEYLVFDCPEDTLDRLLRFLKVLVQNYHSRDVANNEAHFHLANLFACLLLGTVDMKDKLEAIQSERIAQQRLQRELHKKKQEKASIKPATDEIKIDLADDTRPAPVDNKDAIDLSNDSYLNYLGNSLEHTTKTETPDDQRFFNSATNNMYSYSHANDVYIARDSAKTAPSNTNRRKKRSREHMTYNKQVFSPFVTSECSDRFVGDICCLLGYLAGRWGYFEHEITYLLTRRLEIFFFNNQIEWTTQDFQWLNRITQALAVLGEQAFRELTLYFELIPHDQVPVWMKPHLGFGAIYIRGRKDWYFYEYMEEVCGDSLLPFMLYYTKALGKLNDRSLARQKKLMESPPLKIAAKLLVRLKDRPVVVRKSLHTIDDYFPERASQVQRMAVASRKIGFKFAGCCPVIGKAVTKQTNSEPTFVPTDFDKKFNERFVICGRKLLKPIYINKRGDIRLIVDYKRYNI